MSFLNPARRQANSADFIFDEIIIKPVYKLDAAKSFYQE